MSPDWLQSITFVACNFNIVWKQPLWLGSGISHSGTFSYIQIYPVSLHVTVLDPAGTCIFTCSGHWFACYMLKVSCAVCDLYCHFGAFLNFFFMSGSDCIILVQACTRVSKYKHNFLVVYKKTPQSTFNCPVNFHWHLDIQRLAYHNSNTNTDSKPNCWNQSQLWPTATN